MYVVKKHGLSLNNTGDRRNKCLLKVSKVAKSDKNKHMKKGVRYFLITMLILGCIYACAKKGSPTGGPVDEAPPKFIQANPKNYSLQFKAEEVRIYFDEYIQLKDPRRQILISPPMETKAVITPMGTARKYVNIEFKDTLAPNTTYTISFGQSIVDYNEQNPMRYFKYVFSTGDYIDSLKVTGTLHDALEIQPEEFVSVMLYKADSTYSDSLVYKSTPTYITYSKDSTHTFQIENIEEGQYKLVALKDKNRNYKFDPEQDKIAFLEKTIHVPTDTSFHLTLFKEVLNFEAKRPKHQTKQHLIFGYQGRLDSFDISLLSEVPADFQYRVFKDKEKDTLHYFYKPKLEKDSLVFAFSNQNYKDTLVVFLRKLAMDSLKIEASPNGTLDFGKVFTLHANTPIVGRDSTLISIRNKDSLRVPFSTHFDALDNTLQLNFDQEEKQLYRIELLPGALTDFFGVQNDTLQYTLQTKEHTDYGIMSVKTVNLRNFPVIVQLLNGEGKIVREQYSQGETLFSFKNLLPGEYFFRILFDNNQNKRWDTGSFLQKRQPEKVTYFPDTLQVRANWDVVETLVLDSETPWKNAFSKHLFFREFTSFYPLF